MRRFAQGIFFDFLQVENPYIQTRIHEKVLFYYHSILWRNQFPEYRIFVACEELKDDFQLSNAVVSFQNPALNLCILSCCDLLVGPPSTFLTWAAFYQNAKVSYINKYNWDQSKYSFTTTTF